MKKSSDHGENAAVEPEQLRSATMVTLIGGGGVNRAALKEALARAPRLVAADGGADRAFAEGLSPERVIGDMDSLGAARDRLPPEALTLVAEQNTTDFEKAIARIDAPGVLAVGFTGRRLDHELAVYNALVRPSHPPCLVLGETDLAFAAPPSLTLDLPEGSRVSLFPMAAVTGTSEGLAWPIDGLAFAPDGTIGTSNKVQGGPVTLTFDSPGMLVILPLEALDIVLRALGLN